MVSDLGLGEVEGEGVFIAADKGVHVVFALFGFSELASIHMTALVAWPSAPPLYAPWKCQHSKSVNIGIGGRLEGEILSDAQKALLSPYCHKAS